MIVNEKDLLSFLEDYKKPLIVKAVTLNKSYVACVRPIPTICGPEVMCNPCDIEEVRYIISKVGEK